MSALVAAGFALVMTTRSADDPCAHAGDQIDAVWNGARASALRAKLVGSGRSYAIATSGAVIGKLDDYASAWRVSRREACVVTRQRGERSEGLLDRRMMCLDRLLGDVRARVSALETGDGATMIDKAFDVVTRLPVLAACADETALAAAIPPPSDPLLRAKSAELDAKFAAASTQNDLGHYAQGLALAREAIDVARTIDNPPVLARGMCTAADLELRLAKYDDSERDFLECAKQASIARDDALTLSAWIGLVGLVGFHQTLPKEGLRFASVANAMLPRVEQRPDLLAKLRHTHGLVLETADKGDEAYAAYDEAHKLWSTGPAKNDSYAANALSSLAGIRHEQGRYKEAFPLFEQVLQARETLLGKDHPLVVSSLQNLALGYDRQGKYDKALELYTDALARAEAAYGPDHPDVARILGNRATTLDMLDKPDEAIADERRALAIREKAFGPDHADVAMSLGNLAGSLSRIGRHDEAIAMYGRALAINERRFGPAHTNVAFSHAGIARVLYAMERREEALVHFKQALAIREKVLGPSHPDLAGTLSSIGIIEMDLGKLDDAEQHVARSLAISEAKLGKDHPELAYGLGALAGVLMKRGKFAEALPIAERGLAVRTTAKVPTVLIAESKYFLGQALWGSKKDKRKALALAREARAVYVADGAGSEASVREVDRWMRTKKP